MIWAAASEPQYVSHLAPIWREIPEEHRGQFLCSTPAALTEAIRLGCKPQTKLARRIRAGAVPGDPVWMLAAYSDLKHVHPRRAVLVEHGAGQHYGGDGGQPSAGASPHYSGGDSRNAVTLFVCPSELVAARNRATYPDAAAAVVGSPRLDELAACRAARPEPPDDRLTVAVSFHWDCRLVPEARWAWPHWRAAVEELAADPSLRLIGHGHPRAWPHLSRWWATLGAELVPRFDDVVAQADLYVVDNSSTLYEAAALGIPVLVLDAPWYRESVEHGLRFWEWADLGPRLRSGTAEDLRSAIDQALEPHWAEVRTAATEHVYGGTPTGRSGAAAAAAIMEASS